MRDSFENSLGRGNPTSMPPPRGGWPSFPRPPIRMGMPGMGPRGPRGGRGPPLRAPENFVAITSKVHELLGKDRKRVIDMFAAMDVDGSRWLNRREFVSGLRKLGIKLRKEEIKLICKALDTNGDGRIQYEELYNALRNPEKTQKSYMQQRWEHEQRLLEKEQRKIEEQQRKVSRWRIPLGLLCTRLPCFSLMMSSHTIHKIPNTEREKERLASEAPGW